MIKSPVVKSMIHNVDHWDLWFIDYDDMFGPSCIRKNAIHYRNSILLNMAVSYR